MLEAAMSSFPQKEINVPLEYWKEVEDFFLSFPSSDQEILEEIKSTYEQHNYVLDPHTATGVKAAKELAQPNQSVISMATAHPAKFMEAIKQSLGEETVEMPGQLKAIVDKKEDFVILPDNIDTVREYVLSSLE